MQLNDGPLGAPSGTRPRRRLFEKAFCSGLVLALVTAGWSPPAGAGELSSEAASGAAGPVWVCRPGASPSATCSKTWPVRRTRGSRAIDSGR
jgi:hypothetical protein